ncbi:MAG: DNA alkylation repair protein [Ignavibacteriales bacterium]
MNLSIIWNQNNYKEFIDYLHSLSDQTYKDFNIKLNTGNNIIGIRMPILKKIAKEISMNGYNSFIQYNNHYFYEETMIHGLIIGYIKANFETKVNMLNSFIPYINSWGICDSLCTNLTSFKNNLEDGYIIINEYLKSDNPWMVRVGLVLLLNYYINDQYIDKILKLVTNIKLDDYYVKMANAWLISYCYIKYPTKTLTLFKTKKLDKWTHNKAIQKTIESLRITKEEKEMLKDLKI